jgi:hypothetical protein
LRSWTIPLLLTGLAVAGAGLIGCSDNSTGTPTPQFRYINDTQFLRGTYFFIADPDSAPQPQVIYLHVYLDDRTASNDVELGAQITQAWIDPALRTPAGAPLVGAFHLLQENTDYRLLNAAGNGTGLASVPVLALTTPLFPNHVLAVAYRGLVGSDTVEVGTLTPPASGDTLQLKMIRPGTDDWSSTDLTKSEWAPVRRLEMRNVYSLGGKDIDMSSFDLRIVRDVAGDGGNNPFTITNEYGVTTPLIQVLGLDQENNADPLDRTPDGKVDPEYVDLQRGLLFFPDLRPFDPGLADIAGTPFRPRSWPVAAGASRPDTLGWRLENGQAVPSEVSVRSRETIPQIYDLLPRILDIDADEYHIYNLEVTIRP